MNGTLFKREVKANYKILLIFCAVLTLYGSMIISMFDPKLGESLNMMMESMSEIFAAFGMSTPGATLLEFLINYLYGFLFIVFPMIFIIILTNRLVTRYVDRGSMAYLLATPNKRIKIIGTQATLMIGALLVLVLYVTVLCISLGHFMFPGELEIGTFIKVNIGLYGLILFLASVCFCCSCIFNDSKYSTGLGAGLCIAFVLIQMISQVGDKFEGLRYVTPLTLFDASGIAQGQTNSIMGVVSLYIMGVILFAVGMTIFCKRDIPV